MQDTPKNKLKYIHFLFFIVLLIGFSALTLYLFYHQCVESMLGETGSGLYHSDMKAYILEMQGLDSGYSFPYPIFFKLSALLDLFASPELAVALATMLLNSLGLVITKLALDRLALPELEAALPERKKWLGSVLVSLTAVSLFVISMLFPPTGIYLPGIKYNYLGVFTANPWHNATYMAARPFMILAFLWYAKLLDGYESFNGGAGEEYASDAQTTWSKIRTAACPLGSISAWDYVFFSVFLLLATMTKPSFTIVLVGAAGLIMVWRMLRSRFANLKQTILLGLTFLPTFADLLYQYRGVFVPDEGTEGGIGFCFGTIWSQYCGNIPLAICLAVGFPLLVLVLNFRELRTNTLYRFSWQVYGMGFAMAFLLYEKGFRANDFNFSWGYMCGIFCVFLGSVNVLLQSTARELHEPMHPARHTLPLAAEWLAFGWHVACGLYYWWGILQGGMYY